MSGASVTLKTGVQGSGKTLSAVAELRDLLAKWEKNPEEKRPVFVHGIRGIQLDHAELPVYPVRGRPGDPYQKNRVGQPSEPVAVDWEAVPQGAHVIIDEAQYLFPPRATNAAVPAHVAWFAMSRQEGCTVVLMTQAPTSIDIDVRKRCGLHQHYSALYFSTSSVREWSNRVSPTCKDPDTSRVWKHDKAAYALYTSASIHTQGAKPRVPWWVVVPIVGLLVGVVALPFAFKTMKGVMTGKGLSAESVPSPAPAARPGGMFGGQSVPGLPGLPASGPVAVAASAPAEPASSAVLGCIFMQGKCRCIGSDGFAVVVARALCVESSREYSGLIPYPVKPQVRQVDYALSSSLPASAPHPETAARAVDSALANLAR